MNIISTLLEVSLYSMALFGFTMLFKRIFSNRLSPLLHYSIWALLILRLLVPVTLDSGFHLITVPQPAASAAAEANPQTAEPQLSVDTAPIAQANVDTNRQPLFVAQPEREYNATASAMDTAAPAPLSVTDWLLIAWAAGGMAVLTCFTLSHRRLQRRLKASFKLPPAALAELLETCRRSMSIKQMLYISCHSGLGSPALLFPRTILMPDNALDEMSPAQLELALRHELMHYKRRDHIVCVLLMLLLAVYWFNPIVWIAYGRIREDMETACDSMVVKAMSAEDRAHYAHSLLALFSVTSRSRLVLGMALHATRRIAERRIRGIYMEHRSKPLARWTSAVLAPVLLIACFTTACQPVALKDDAVNSPVGAATPGKTAEADMQTGGVDAAAAGSLVVQERVNDYYASEDKLYEVSVDADVRVPDVTQYPVVQLRPRPFNDDDVQSMIAVLMRGQEVYDQPDQHTKAQLERQIVRLKTTLAQIENASEASASRKTLNSSIKELEDQYAEAPDSIELVKSDLRFKVLDKYEPGKYVDSTDGTGNLVFITDLGKEDCAQIGILNNSDGSGQMTFFNHNFGYYSSNFASAFEDIPLPRMTQAEAQAIAVNAVDNIGAGLSLSGKAYSYKYTPSSTGNGTVKFADGAYSFFFTRTVSGIPTTYEFESGNAQEDGASISPWPYERIAVIVDDTGIIELDWSSPTDIGDVLLSNAEVMSSAAALDVFKKQLDNRCSAKYGSDITKKYERIKLHIDDIRLGYTRISSGKDDDDYRLVPVWDFFGMETSVSKNAPKDSDEAYENILPYCSLMTINAMDGSVVDRSLGY